MPWVFLLAVAAASCDYRLVEETKYTSFNLSALGLNERGRSLCANGFYSGTLGPPQTLDDFLAQSEGYIRNETLKLITKLAGGNETNDLVILDLESPLHYNDLWHYNDSRLQSVVSAVRMRVRVVRGLVPRARLALYGQTAQDNATVAAGYARAARLGMWDAVDYLVPVLYLGSDNENATHLAELRLRATAAITTSRGAHIPMAPLLSWVHFPSGCAAPYKQTHDVLDTIRRLRAVLPPQPNPLPIVHLWSGKDNETSSADASCAMAATTQLAWLRGANIVPSSCLHR
jgi:hypothetical protein